MRVADFPPSQYFAVFVSNADEGRFTIGLLLTYVEQAILVYGDVVRPTHACPHANELAIGREYLDTPVGSVTDINLSIGVYQ